LFYHLLSGRGSFRHALLLLLLLCFRRHGCCFATVALTISAWAAILGHLCFCASLLDLTNYCNGGKDSPFLASLNARASMRSLFLNYMHTFIGGVICSSS
jgi:hypothetical protein